MPEGMDITRVESTLAKYQSLVTAGLAFIVVFTVSMVGVMLFQSYRMGQQSEQIKAVAVSTHSALCALRNARLAEQASSKKFLKEHPNGLTDRYGSILISAAQIQGSIDSQQTVIDALKGGGLTCP